MKWKNGVTVLRDGSGYMLKLDNDMCMIEEEAYIIEAVESGTCDDEELKKIIIKHEKSNDVIAGLTLARFILNYQRFVEEDREHYSIVY